MKPDRFDELVLSYMRPPALQTIASGASTTSMMHNAKFAVITEFLQPLLAVPGMNMALLWIPATIVASAAQTARNAMQRSLTGTLGTVGATQVRFLYGLPFSLVFLLLVASALGEPVTAPGGRALAFALGGALTQIAATALMLLAMKDRSFAVTTAIIKTEPVLVTLAGIIVLGDWPTPLAGFGIVIATLGVLLLSVKPGSLTGWSGSRPIVIGVMSGGFFALSAISFRGAIIAMGDGSPVLRASTILVTGLLMQVFALVLWMALFNRPAIGTTLRAWRPSLLAGFMGAFASQFWFIGFALTSAANVRTLALIEVLFAQGVSWRFLSQGTNRREIAGIALIVAGVGLLLLHVG